MDWKRVKEREREREKDWLKYKKVYHEFFTRIK
jgi:hypothetical protein